MPRHSPYALLSLNSLVYCLAIYLVLYRLNCCVSRFSVAFLFRSGKIVFFLPFSERPDFLNLRLFPLLNIKSVRVLNSSYSVFNELCRLSPALNRLCGFNIY